MGASRWTPASLKRRAAELAGDMIAAIELGLDVRGLADSKKVAELAAGTLEMRAKAHTR